MFFLGLCSDGADVAVYKVISFDGVNSFWQVYPFVEGVLFGEDNAFLTLSSPSVWESLVSFNTDRTKGFTHDGRNMLLPRLVWIITVSLSLLMNFTFPPHFLVVVLCVITLLPSRKLRRLFYSSLTVAPIYFSSQMRPGVCIATSQLLSSRDLLLSIVQIVTSMGCSVLAVW